MDSHTAMHLNFEDHIDLSEFAGYSNKYDYIPIGSIAIVS